jgi:hypothetical protein
MRFVAVGNDDCPFLVEHFFILECSTWSNSLQFCTYIDPGFGEGNANKIKLIFGPREMRRIGDFSPVRRLFSGTGGVLSPDLSDVMKREKACLQG